MEQRVEQPTMGDDAEPEIDFSMKKKKARRACRAHCTAQAQLYVHQAVSSLGGATPRVACSLLLPLAQPSPSLVRHAFTPRLRAMIVCRSTIAEEEARGGRGRGCQGGAGACGG